MLRDSPSAARGGVAVKGAKVRRKLSAIIEALPTSSARLSTLRRLSGRGHGDGLELAGGDALAPLGRAGGVHAGAVGIHRHRDGHVHDVELVDGFHAQVFETE